MLNTPLPIITLIRRELLTSLRSWKSLALLLAMMLLLLYAASETMEASFVYTTAAAAMGQYFTILIWCLYILASTVVPAMAAVSINSEHDSGNWDLLATSLIPPSQVVLGKYLAVLIYFLLYGVAVLPLVGLVYFYAGVDMVQFYEAMIWIVPTALCNAAVGLWASVTCEKTGQAIVRAFSIVFLLYVFYVIVQWVPRYLALTGAGAPFYFFGMFPLSPTARAWYQLVAGLLFLAGAVYLATVRTGAVATTIQTVRTSVDYTRNRFLNPPQIRIPDGANPFGFRDLAGTAGQSRVGARVFFFALVFAYFGLLFFFRIVAPGMEMGMGIIERIVILCVVPPLVAIAVVREREETTMDMYRMTLMEGTDLVKGKAMGFIRQHRPVLLALLVCKTLLVLCIVSDVWEVDQYGPPKSVFVVDLLTLPVHLLMVICTSIAGALFPRSTLAAIGTAYGFLFVGVMMFLYVQVQVIDNGGTGNELTEILVFLTGHFALCVFALMIAFGCAIVRITALWDYTR